MAFNLGEFEGLDDKQRLWLSEYLVDFNGVRSAKLLNIPYSNVRRWLCCDPIKKAINYYLEKRRLENEKLVQRTLDELFSLMTSDIKEFADWDAGTVTLKSSKDLQNTKVIKGLKQGKMGVEIILHDKVRAVELMMQGLGMLKRPIEADKGKGKEIPEGSGETLFEALENAHAERRMLPASIKMDGAVDADVEDVEKDEDAKS